MQEIDRVEQQTAERIAELVNGLEFGKKLDRSLTLVDTAYRRFG